MEAAPRVGGGQDREAVCDRGGGEIGEDVVDLGRGEGERRDRRGTEQLAGTPYLVLRCDPLGAPLRLTDVHQSLLPGVTANTEHGGFLVVWTNAASLSPYAQHIAVTGTPHVSADGFETGDLAAWTSERATLRREPP